MILLFSQDPNTRLSGLVKTCQVRETGKVLVLIRVINCVTAVTMVDHECAAH
jgi:hypothetical protein